MQTDQKLKRILIDWKDFELPYIMKREFDDGLLKSDKILTITGPRRSGKTFLCYQLMEELRENVPEDNILYINFEDERLHPMKGDELTQLLEIYYEIFRPSSGKKYFILDEIQEIENWDRWCRRIDEQEKDIKLIITGSSSKLLSRELSTSLRGRSLNWKVFPLSFREYLGFKGIKVREHYSTKERSKIKRYFNEYIENGGFPEAVLEEDEKVRNQILQEYFSTIFYKDIVERFNVGNVPALHDFLKILLDNFACKMTLTKSMNYLKSMDHKVGKDTLRKYLEHAKEVFFLFTLERYSQSTKKRKLYPRKVYPVDTGLVNAVRFDFSQEYGRALENVVFIELMRRGKEIYYHENHGECDFMVKHGRDFQGAIQVTRSLEGTRERELGGLTDAMTELDVKRGTILTYDETEDITVDKRSIQVRPVWQWLLEV